MRWSGSSGLQSHSSESLTTSRALLPSNSKLSQIAGVHQAFPIGLKRGINGTYHHVSQKHLKRYLGEFDFRYNERAALGVGDVERTSKAVLGTVGKRVTYQETGRAGA